MNRQEIMQKDAEFVMNTYKRLPVVAKHASKAALFDVDGTEYIDFAAGIGVNALGSADAQWVEAVTSQMKNIAHTSNYYYSEPVVTLAEKLVRLSGMSKAFFANSGAEANEGALKLARKYSFDKYGSGRNVIVTLKNSFHGRTMTTLTMTGQDRFHKYYAPFAEGIKYTEANNLESLESSLDDNVCAIFIELIQGEGGVNILDKEYVQSINDICRRKDILLICDEVQTGTGRTGKFFAYEHFDILPDIVTLAKGIGGGLPLGCILCSEKLKDVFAPGDHGSTFGANAAICAGACVVADKVSDTEFLKEVTLKGEYLMNEIKNINSPIIQEVRGIGLMIGLLLNNDPKIFIERACENKLLLLSAGQNVIRLLPPLVISYSEIDKGISILKKIFK